MKAASLAAKRRRAHVNRDDIAQLFIVHPQGFSQGMMSFFSSLFSTHPDTEKRIEILEQF